MEHVCRLLMHVNTLKCNSQTARRSADGDVIPVRQLVNHNLLLYNFHI